MCYIGCRFDSESQQFCSFIFLRHVCPLADLMGGVCLWLNFVYLILFVYPCYISAYAGLYVAVSVWTLTRVLMNVVAFVFLNNFSPFSNLSSVPDAKLDWLLADEGGTNRPLSSSPAWVTSPPSELFRESLRAERDDEVLLLSLRGLLEFRPAGER